MSSCIGMMMNDPCIGMMMNESSIGMVMDGSVAIDYFKKEEDRYFKEEEIRYSKEEEVRAILADYGIAEDKADEICTPEFIHGLPETEEGIVEILAMKFGFDTP